jgi:hypothetical protein
MVWGVIGGVIVLAVVVFVAISVAGARQLGEVVTAFQAAQKMALRAAAVAQSSQEGAAGRKRSPASRRTSRDVVVTYGIGEDQDDFVHEVTVAASGKPEKFVIEQGLMVIMELNQQFPALSGGPEPELEIIALSPDSHMIRYRLNPTQQELLQALVASPA